MIYIFIGISIGSKDDTEDAVKLIKEIWDIKGLKLDGQDLHDPHHLRYWVVLDGDDDTVYKATCSLKDIAKRYHRNDEQSTLDRPKRLDMYAESCAMDDSERYANKYYSIPTSSDDEYTRLVKKYEEKDVGGFLINLNEW